PTPRFSASACERRPSSSLLRVPMACSPRASTKPGTAPRRPTWREHSTRRSPDADWRLSGARLPDDPDVDLFAADELALHHFRNLSGNRAGYFHCRCIGADADRAQLFRADARFTGNGADQVARPHSVIAADVEGQDDGAALELLVSAAPRRRWTLPA